MVSPYDETSPDGVALPIEAAPAGVLNGIEHRGVGGFYTLKSRRYGEAWQPLGISDRDLLAQDLHDRG
jgi:hypothetical protein